MTARTKKALRSVLSLPEAEQEEVLREVLAHLEGDGSTREEMETAWGAEIKRRIDDMESGRVKMIPGEQVMRELKGRIKALRRIRSKSRRPRRNVRSRNLV